MGPPLQLNRKHLLNWGKIKLYFKYARGKQVNPETAMGPLASYLEEKNQLDIKL